MASGESEESNVAVFVHTLSKALKERSQGSTENYNLVLQEFGRKDSPDSVLAQWLQALKACSALLDEKFEPLVGLTLKIDWTSKDDAFADVFVDYLLEIVCTKPTYIGPCIGRIVGLFACYSEDEGKMRVVSSRAHKALKAVLSIVPRAIGHVPASVVKLFPFKMKKAEIQDCYLSNILLLADYVPNLSLPVLECVFYKMIEIDAELPREMSETQFDVEMPGITDEKEMLQANLDVMMSRLLAYCKETCCPDGVYEEDVASNFFDVLIEVFMKCLLKTHGASHVQFILFYTCSLGERLYAKYLESIWAKVESPSSSIIERQSAAMYIGSFVARAKFLPTNYTKEMLSYMVAWLHRYVDYHDRTASVAASSHAPFYAVCQAVFCVFIFCHLLILEEESGLSYLQSLNLARIVQSRLNPLKFCAPTVVDMFALISRRYQVAFCYTVIEHNRRVAGLAVAKGMEDPELLHSFKHFFPYDAYHLPKSGQVVKPLQRELSLSGHEADISEEESTGRSFGSSESWTEKNEFSLVHNSHGSHFSPRFTQSPVNAYVDT